MSGEAINSYKELIGCLLHDDVCNRLAYTYLNGYVRRRSTVDLLFDHPITVKPGTKYRLSVSLLRPGCYPMPKTSSNKVDLGDANFTFYADDSELNDTFIRGAIFRF